MLSATQNSFKNSLAKTVSIVQKQSSNSQVRYFAASRFALQTEKKTEEAKSEATETEEKTAEQIQLDEFQAKLDKSAADLKKFKDLYIRSVADFRNLQETTKKDVTRAKDFGLQKFSKDLIETIDNFGHCIKSFEGKEKNEEIKILHEGVEMTYNIFKKTLNKHGIAEVNPIGEKFDPNVHEATFEFPDPSKEAGTVFHVQQPGYTLNGRVIRPAKVGVVKASE
ncbi:hypothetical protein QEN19_001518 [Hanseniaspora menglaensis]